MNLEKCLRLIKSKGFHITLGFTVGSTRRYEVYADHNPKSLNLLSFKKLGSIILDDNLQDVLFVTQLTDLSKDIMELLQCKYLFSDSCHSYFKCCRDSENG